MRSAAICGGTIYVQTLGTSRTAAGGSGMTYVQERAAILGLDKDPAFKGDIPEPSGDASSGRKFQLAPVLVAKMKDNLVSGRFVTGKPRFRAMAWSPALPADDECLIATCSSDHHVAICAPPTGYGKTWRQIACLSDLLLKQLKKVGHDPRRIASLSDSAAAASPPMPDACLRKLGLASTFTVAWSQRTSRSDGKLMSWIAMGGAQSLSIFTHTTASTRSFSTGGTAAQSPSFPASHSFNCSELVARHRFGLAGRRPFVADCRRCCSRLPAPGCRDWQRLGVALVRSVDSILLVAHPLTGCGASQECEHGRQRKTGVHTDAASGHLCR